MVESIRKFEDLLRDRPERLIGMGRQDVNTPCQDLGAERWLLSPFLDRLDRLREVCLAEDFEEQEVVIGAARFQSPRSLDFDKGQVELLELEQHSCTAK